MRIKIHDKDYFIKKYGENWRKKLAPAWNHRGEMDYLLNAMLPSVEPNKSGIVSIGGWVIGEDSYVILTEKLAERKSIIGELLCK